MFESASPILGLRVPRLRGVWLHAVLLLDFACSWFRALDSRVGLFCLQGSLQTIVEKVMEHSRDLDSTLAMVTSLA